MTQLDRHIFGTPVLKCQIEQYARTIPFNGCVFNPQRLDATTAGMGVPDYFGPAVLRLELLNRRSEVLVSFFIVAGIRRRVCRHNNFSGLPWGQ